MTVGRILLAAAFVLALSGCHPIEPWVKPFEREHLADPIMAFDRAPVSSAYIDHVFEAREGARGACEVRRVQSPQQLRHAPAAHDRPVAALLLERPVAEVLQLGLAAEVLRGAPERA